MPDIQVLREKRSGLMTEITGHIELAMSDVDAYESAGGISKHAELNKQLQQNEQVIKLTEESIRLQGERQVQPVADAKGISVDEAMNERQRAVADFHAYLLGGPTSKGLSEAGRAHYARPFSVRGDPGEPLIEPKALGEDATDLNSASDTAAAAGSDGVSVPIIVARDIVLKLKSRSGMRAAGTVQSVRTGRSQVHPIIDDTTNQGEILARGATATDQDIREAGRAVNFNVISSKTVPVGIDWLQDTESANVVETITNLLAERIARICNKAMTAKGSTGAAGNGILDDAPLGVTLASGNATSFGFDDLRKLWESVDPAYQMANLTLPQDDMTRQTGQGGTARASFMAGWSTLNMILGFKDNDGRPYVVPSYMNGGRLSYMGAPFYLNVDMPAPAANAKTLMFGQLSNFEIYDVMRMELLRFTDSNYARKRQVGFLAFMRSGWRLIDGGDSVKVMAQSAS